jgi:hypothetical protein
MNRSYDRKPSDLGRSNIAQEEPRRNPHDNNIGLINTCALSGLYLKRVRSEHPLRGAQI